MQRAKFSLVAISLLTLTSCNNIPLPVGQSCVMFYDRGYNLCFDMEKDFNEDGSVKPDAVAKKILIDAEYLKKNRLVNFDPQSYANLKAYLLKQKARCEGQ